MTYVNYDIDRWVLYSRNGGNKNSQKEFVFVSKDNMGRILQLHKIHKGIENAPDEEEVEIVLSSLDENNAITTSDVVSSELVNKLTNEWVLMTK